MSENLKKTLRWGAGIIGVLILAAAGYVTIDTVTTFNDAQQELANIASELLQAPEEDAVASLRDIVVSGEDGDPTQEGDAAQPDDEPNTEGDVAEAAPAAEQTDGLVLPSTELLLAANIQEVPLQIRNTMTETVTNVLVQLLVVNKVNGSSIEQLSPGFTGSDTIQAIKADETANLSIKLDQLPPSGKYEAWVQISSDNGKPSAMKTSLQAATYMADSIVVRQDDSGQTAPIVISGVNLFPGILRVAHDDDWDWFELRVWQDRKGAQNEVLSVLTTELSSDEGLSGLLQAFPKWNIEKGRQALSFKLHPTDLDFPGAYHGDLVIYASDGSTGETIKVTANLRDLLLWPFLVIFIGALINGWLLRKGTKSKDKNAGFLELHIARVRDDLARITACRSRVTQKCRIIEQDLLMAEAAVAIGDYPGAKQLIQDAEAGIKALRSASIDLQAAAEKIKEREKGLAAANKNPKEIDSRLSRSNNILGRARIQYQHGDLDEMQATLAKLDGALKRASAADLADALEIFDVPETAEGLELAERKGPRPTVVIEPGDRSVFYGDEELTLRLINGGNSQYHWELSAVPAESFSMTLPQGDQKVQVWQLGIARILPQRLRVAAIFADGHRKNIAREIEVRHRHKIITEERLVAKQPIDVKLDPDNGAANAAELTWKAHCLEFKTWASGGDVSDGLIFTIDPPQLGNYIVEVFAANGCLVAYQSLFVGANPFDEETKEVKQRARAVNIAWALVAAVVGLLYISARVPTFGSPMDYVLALAWALGVSAVAIPSGNIAGEIYKTITKDDPLSRQGAVETQEDPNKDEVTKKVAPTLTDLSLEKAHEKAGKEGLTVKPEPTPANKSQMVSGQNPKAGEDLQGKTEIELTLEQNASPATKKMPKLKEMTLGQAYAKAESEGVLISEPKLDQNNETRLVIEQAPEEGRAYAAGTQIVLTLAPIEEEE